ncbi:MAG: helix-turn-helix transcriptional regulator [Candidatus Methanomethylophilaceae archaeon]|nr:helix-turn-helix transcriptional regulator [Candidatus Methanomethylophilaceae archaeon]
MISGIKEFYAALQSGELDSDVPLQDTEKIRREYGKELAIKLRWQHGMQVKDFAELFGVSRNTIGNWVNDSRPKPGDT